MELNELAVKVKDLWEKSNDDSTRNTLREVENELNEFQERLDAARDERNELREGQAQIVEDVLKLKERVSLTELSTQVKGLEEQIKQKASVADFAQARTRLEACATKEDIQRVKVWVLAGAFIALAALTSAVVPLFA